MKKADLKVSEDVRKLNPHLFGMGGLHPAQRQQNTVEKTPMADGGKEGCPRGLVISIVQFRHRKLDSDNLAFAAKWLRDSIAGSIGIDDGDERVTWQYAQIQTAGREGCAVTIEVL